MPKRTGYAPPKTARKRKTTAGRGRAPKASGRAGRAKNTRNRRPFRPNANAAFY